MKRLSNVLLFIFISAAILAGCDATVENTIPIENGEEITSNSHNNDSQTSEETVDIAPQLSPVDPALSSVSDTGEPSYTLEDGVLTISGSGVLMEKPWEKSYHDETVRSITKILIGNGITDLPYSAFGDHDSLVSVAIGDGITYVPPETFIGCTSLKQVYFGTNITFIDGGAFERCGLEEIAIPDTVTFINIGAFANCVDLEKILIPASVTEIGEDAFKNCERLTIFAPKGSYAEKYAEENDMLFSAVD